MTKNDAFQRMLRNQNLIDSVMNPLTDRQKEEFLELLENCKDEEIMSTFIDANFSQYLDFLANKAIDNAV